MISLKVNGSSDKRDVIQNGRRIGMLHKNQDNEVFFVPQEKTVLSFDELYNIRSYMFAFKRENKPC